MSEHTNNYLINKPKYFQNKNKNQNQNQSRNQNQNQVEFIRTNEKLLPYSIERISKFNLNGYYDPYIGLLHDKGLFNFGDIRRTKTIFINIDSRFRKKEPNVNTDELINLERDPLVFTAGLNKVFIKHANHNFQQGDLITLTNIFGKQIILRTFDDKKNPTFEIPQNCNFIKFFYKHNIPIEYNNSNIDIEIELQGIKGDNDPSFLGNIPINLINGRHKIKLELDETDLISSCNINDFPETYFNFSPNYFFISLPKSIKSESYQLLEYNFKLIFLSIAGVPLNLLNATFPIDPDHQQGFHIIRSVQKNGYEIEIPINAIFNEVGGGTCVTVAKILNINPGFPNPNKYIIDLGVTFNNIISARIISSEIPNSNKNIKEFPPELANNKIFWNNINDGEYLYSIEVPEGNYSVNQLITTLESLFLKTPRINNNNNNGSISYTSKHIVKVNINEITNEVKFQTFLEAILIQPIVNIDPEITTDFMIGSNDPKTTYEITIYHPNHKIVHKDVSIIISGAISHLGIPQTVLNGEHIISEIVDNNHYKIKLPRFNLLDERINTKGGTAVTVLVPDQFRLRFDKENTIGRILGFRMPGNPFSITKFSHIISNKDPYEFENNKNELGEVINIVNNNIQLTGETYILMKAKPLETLISLGSVKNAFAKILLCNQKSEILFNTFVPTIRIYTDPIHELEKLEIEFLTPEGFLYDFHGLDHSFTLQLEIINDIPEGTGITPSTGKNYNYQIFSSY